MLILVDIDYRYKVIPFRHSLPIPSPILSLRSPPLPLPLSPPVPSPSPSLNQLGSLGDRCTFPHRGSENAFACIWCMAVSWPLAPLSLRQIYNHHTTSHGEDGLMYRCTNFILSVTRYTCARQVKRVFPDKNTKVKVKSRPTTTHEECWWGAHLPYWP